MIQISKEKYTLEVRNGKIFRDEDTGNSLT